MTEVSRFFDDASRELTAALRSMIRAEAANRPQPLDRMASALRRHMAAADMIGRLRAVRQADAAGRVRAAAAPITDPVTGVVGVTFEQALADFVSREPRLAGSAEEVARTYGEERGFALAADVGIEVVGRVQRAIARELEEGRRAGAGEVEALLADWGRAYAQTVLRTNIATAHSAGRMRMAADPVVRERLPAFQYSAVRDRAVRPAHRAMHGFVALTTAPVWGVWAPPNGFNCRCSLRLVSVHEMARRGLEAAALADPRPPTSLLPDPGFRQRPDAGLYA